MRILWKSMKYVHFFLRFTKYLKYYASQIFDFLTHHCIARISSLVCYKNREPIEQYALCNSYNFRALVITRYMIIIYRVFSVSVPSFARKIVNIL